MRDPPSSTPPNEADGAPPDAAEPDDTPTSPTHENTPPDAFRDSADGDVWRSHQHMPSPVLSLVIAAPPVRSFADFSTGAVSDKPPASFLYPGLWSSLTFKARQDIIIPGSRPVLAAVHVLREAEAKAAAELLAAEHHSRVAAARDDVASTSPEAQTSAREEQRRADYVAQLRSQMADAEHRSEEAAARSRRKIDAKEVALRALVMAEAGAPSASGKARHASPAAALDEAGTASIAAAPSLNDFPASRTRSGTSAITHLAPLRLSWVQTVRSARASAVPGNSGNTDPSHSTTAPSASKDVPVLLFDTIPIQTFTASGGSFGDNDGLAVATAANGFQTSLLGEPFDRLPDTLTITVALAETADRAPVRRLRGEVDSLATII